MPFPQNKLRTQLLRLPGADYRRRFSAICKSSRNRGFDPANLGRIPRGRYENSLLYLISLQHPQRRRASEAVSQGKLHNTGLC